MDKNDRPALQDAKTLFVLWLLSVAALLLLQLSLTVWRIEIVTVLTWMGVIQ
jgi:hypothetical protein